MSVKKQADIDNKLGSHEFVLVFCKNSGLMRVTYFMVDPRTNSLLPKPCIVKWPRLTDLVDYRACVLKDYLYIIGGKEKSTGRMLKQTLRYDPASGRWKECAKMKKARCGHTATAFNGRIYVIGGESQTGELMAHCESYEPLTDEWHREETLLGPRKDHACVATQDAIYLCGGVSKAEPFSDHIWVLKKYAPDKHFPQKFIFDWFPFKDKSQKSMTHRRAKHNVLMARKKMFILGGVTKGQVDTDQKGRRKSKKTAVSTCAAVEAYRFSSRSREKICLPVSSLKDKVSHWNTNQTQVAHKTGAQAIVIGEKSRDQSSWIYDIPDNPTPRCGAGAVTVGNKIYVIGGHAAQDPDVSINEVQYYHTKRRQWTDAFALDFGDYRDVDCFLITAPITNKDFNPVKFGDCKWVMW